MRRRLTVIVLLSAALTAVWWAPVADAQVPPTHGELIPGGAAATASYNEFDTGSGPAPVAPKGRNTNRSCWYEARLVGESYSRAGLADLQQRLGEQQAAGGNDQLQVRYVCEDADTAANRTVVPTTWPRNGAPAFVVPPRVLADEARDMLWFPPPAGATAPSLGEGTVAQLDTFLTVGNWAPVAVRATAGGVWAQVTATPVSQHWVIRDNYRGERYEVDCDGAGASFDPASGLAPPAGSCVWSKPPHSSAGQSSHSNLAGSAQGQPCFPATVTINWSVAWTTNASGVAGGPLEPGGQSAASTCIVVKEVQAVVSGDGSGE